MAVKNLHQNFHITKYQRWRKSYFPRKKCVRNIVFVRKWQLMMQFLRMTLFINIIFKGSADAVFCGYGLILLVAQLWKVDFLAAAAAIITETAAETNYYKIYIYYKCTKLIFICSDGFVIIYSEASYRPRKFFVYYF